MVALKPGTIIMACDIVSGLNLAAGGTLPYRPGDRFRIKLNTSDSLFCLDEQNRTIVFNRENLQDIETHR